MAASAYSIPALSRRSFFGSAIAAGTCAGLAISPAVDQLLVSLCSDARALIDAINNPMADRSDDADAESLREYDRLLEAVARLKPETNEGLKAKVDLAQYEMRGQVGKPLADMHASDRLIWTALDDAVRLKA